jgi:hypothetical protein
MHLLRWIPTFVFLAVMVPATLAGQCLLLVDTWVGRRSTAVIPDRRNP